jgi:hypothetical protein
MKFKKNGVSITICNKTSPLMDVMKSWVVKKRKLIRGIQMDKCRGGKKKPRK